MARSLDKGSRLGKLPPCLICMGSGEGERAQLHLPYGVSVWLCAGHRSSEFQARRAGRDFVVSLWRAWEAAGCLTRARSRALDAHRGRVPPGGVNRAREPQRVEVIIVVGDEASKAGGVEAISRAWSPARIAAIDPSDR